MMRVLDTETLKVRFKRKDEEYAILSHVWGDEEVSFQDIQDPDKAEGMLGFSKLAGAAALALSDGYECVWVDTCCIDKTSSAELSEAINSMFNWYQKSSVCYAYLATVEVDDPSQANPMSAGLEQSFRSSPWFGRGWTLQELIAPPIVMFYSKDWTLLGTKYRLMNVISEITRIDLFVLEHGNHNRVSIARRMSWASGRRTTREEDIAYCLMGLFGVNMPLLYGEGKKAFIRLQKEILNSSDDQSLFVSEGHGFRDGHKISGEERLYNTLFALSPDEFQQTGKMVPLFMHRQPHRSASTLTNRGLHIRLPLVAVRYNPGQPYIASHLVILDCPYGPDPGAFAAIGLDRLQLDDPFTYRRRAQTIHKVSLSPDGDSHCVDPTRLDTWKGMEIKVPKLTYSSSEIKESFEFAEVTIVDSNLALSWIVPPISILLGPDLSIIGAHPANLWDRGTSTMFWLPTFASPAFACAFLIRDGRLKDSPGKLLVIYLALRASFSVPPKVSASCRSLKCLEVQRNVRGEQSPTKEDPKEAEHLMGLLQSLDDGDQSLLVLQDCSEGIPFTLSLLGCNAVDTKRLLLKIGYP